MDNCPKCNSSWIGDPIPENIREHYSPPYCWKREIGISWNDRVQQWMCPDCNTKFSRWTNEEVIETPNIETKDVECI
jgi:transposase-like protein